MRIDFDRGDIHAGDHHRSRTFEVPPLCTTVEALELIAPHLPQIDQGWVIRARIHGSWETVGTCGSDAAPVTMEMPDVPLQNVVEDDVVKVFGVPARELPSPAASG